MTANHTFRNTSIHTLRDALTGLESDGAALGHFNVADHVLLKAVVAAAAETNLPVFVGASEGEREFFGARQLAVLMKSVREESDVPVFLNADHTHSLAKALEAANAGFDAVGVDFSALPFDQNVARTKETVQAIKAVNPAILAEGEIGNIGTGSEIHETAQGDHRLSTPEEARQFVEATGIDILAPAVGKWNDSLRARCQEKRRSIWMSKELPKSSTRPGSFSRYTAGPGPKTNTFARQSPRELTSFTAI